MKQPRVFKTTADECLIYYRGWTISVTCEKDQTLEWKNLKVTLSDQRVKGQKWDDLRPLKDLDKKEHFSVKKLAIGALTKKREADQKRLEKVVRAREEAERSPKFL